MSRGRKVCRHEGSDHIEGARETLPLNSGRGLEMLFKKSWKVLRNTGGLPQNSCLTFSVPSHTSRVSGRKRDHVRAVDVVIPGAALTG